MNNTISVRDALAMVGDDDAVFVDAREAGERVQGAIPGSVHAPCGFLEFIVDLQGPVHKPELARGRRIVVF